MKKYTTFEKDWEISESRCYFMALSIDLLLFVKYEIMRTSI